MAEFLPNLLVIGAMKCGTTSFHHYLDQHPDIFMSEKKEVDYFVEERHWNKGIDWYRSHFSIKSPIRGESSQNYSKRHRFSGVPERIVHLLPEVKLIYLVRDPVERILSHYYENVMGGEAPEDINQFLQSLDDNHYVLTSQYHYQLEAYQEHFSEDAIMVISLEDLQQNRLQTMNRVFTFLGVDAQRDDSLFDFVANDRSSKKKPTQLSRAMLGQAAAPLRKLIPRGVKDWIKGRPVYENLSFEDFQKNVSISEEVQDRIREFLRPDVEALRKRVGQNFNQWSV